MPGPGAIPIPIAPGQRPTPEQIQQIQRRIAEDAAKAGMSVPQFIEQIRKQTQEKAMAARMAQQQAGGGGPPGAPQQVQQQRQATNMAPGPPKPEALAVAKFLRSQELKPRTCILNGERKDMFKGVYTGREMQGECV